MLELSQTVFTNRQRWHTADHNFPFSIFNFQFKNFRSGIFSIALTRLSSRTGNGGSPPAVLKIYFDEIIRLVGNAYA